MHAISDQSDLLGIGIGTTYNTRHKGTTMHHPPTMVVIVLGLFDASQFLCLAKLKKAKLRASKYAIKVRLRSKRQTMIKRTHKLIC